MPGYTPDNDGTFDAEFKIAIPEMQSATRSFAKPEIKNLWLFIFDSSGYISQALEVTNDDVGSITDETDGNTWEDNEPTEFTVKVNVIAETSYSRTIHLIANLPEGTNTNGFFAESNFISSLKTSGTQDAYWQRVEMPNGITKATINALGVIPMVRNYAKVSVVENATDFEVDGLILTNIPNSGSVAPYHTNTLGLDSEVLALLNGNFANYQATFDADGNYTGVATDYEALEKQEYNGFEPSDVAYSNQDVPATWQTYQYLYERNHSETEDRTYAIIRGTYGGQETYYKVDIVKPSGDAYNLLRNIEYKIVVTSVTGLGFNSATEAINSSAVSNNLNFNIVTRNLLNVSDGKSRLFIEYSQKVITTGNSKITFRYRYVPDITKPTTSQNVTGNNVKISWSDFKDGVKSGDAVIADADTSTDDVDWVSNKAVTDSEGYIWNEVTFKVADVGDEAKIQEFILSATKTATDGSTTTLSRVVELRLVKPFKFSIDVAPKVDDGAGKAVPTTLTLPKGLPKGIFPLTFNVVCGNGSLTSSLPVVTGLDINGMPNENGKYFGYAVTIDYDNYDSDNGTVLYPEFSTNMADAALAIDKQTSTNQKDAANNGTKVRAYNPYFEPDFSQFWIGKLYGLGLATTSYTSTTATTSFQINTSGQDIAWPEEEKYFDFKILSDHKLTSVKDNNENAIATTVAEIVNNGKTLRVKMPANGATLVTNYKLTFEATNIVDTTITISNAEFGTARAVVEKYAVSWSIVGTNNDSNQTTMSSDSEYRLRIVLPAGMPDDVIKTLKITATTTNTTLSLNNVDYKEPLNITPSMYDRSTGYIYVPIKATTAGSYNSSRSFTLTLDGGDMFVLPETITKNYQYGSYR